MTAWMIGAAALLLGAGGQAQGGMAGMKMDAAPACPATPAAAPAEFAQWAAPVPIAAGSDAGSAAALPVGTAATVTLGDATTARYAVAPAHQPAASTHGGLLSLTIAAPGRYRVALGAGAWIDLVQGTTPLHSAAHGHGPACTGIRKIVDFDLTPGRYLLQLSGNAAPALGVMVVRAAG